MIKNTLISLLKTAVLVMVVVGGMVVYADWSAPPAAAPGCPSSTPGCNVPINVSDTDQTKSGGFNAKAVGLTGWGAQPPLVFGDYYSSPVSGPNKIKLYGSANTLGFGIDASTLDYHSPSMHRWNIGSLIGAMTLSPSGAAAGLNVNGNIVGTGDVKGGTRLCIANDCRSAWPGGGSGGGSGDNLGNHIATQDLQMIDGNAVKHSVKNAAVVQADNAILQQLNVTGPATLDGLIKITPHGIGGPISPPTRGQVLKTTGGADGIVYWGDSVNPDVQILGPLTSRQSAPPLHYTLAGTWNFCAINSIFNDGGSDNAPAIGCQLIPGSGNTWSVDVFGANTDETSCTIMCMKFN